MTKLVNTSLSDTRSVACCKASVEDCTTLHTSGLLPLLFGWLGPHVLIGVHAGSLTGWLAIVGGSRDLVYWLQTLLVSECNLTTHLYLNGLFDCRKEGVCGAKYYS